MIYRYIHLFFDLMMYHMVLSYIFARYYLFFLGIFLLYYFVTGIFSGLLSFFLYYLTGNYRVFLLGASGAVYAVLFAYAVCYPRSMIYLWGILPVPAPILVLIYALIEVFSGFFSTSNVAHFTHLFGFLVALLYFIIRMGVNPLKIWKDGYRK